MNNFKKYCLLVLIVTIALPTICLYSNKNLIKTEKLKNDFSIDYYLIDSSIKNNAESAEKLLNELRNVYLNAFSPNSKIEENSYPQEWDARIKEAKKITWKDIYFHVIRHKNQPCGFIKFAPKKKGEISVAQLAVDPDFQKKGLGRKLISSIFEALKKVQTIKLMPRKVTQGFYKRLGFEQCKRNIFRIELIRDKYLKWKKNEQS